MITTGDEEAIIALCTPRGAGAIALIRISGTNTLSLIDAFTKLSSGKQLSTRQTHTIHHGYVVQAINKEKIIDDVLFFVMLAPRTFTKQNTIEISCHNNPMIIESIIEQGLQAGMRHAQPGEFSKRAFLNGKIDLIQAEAINELIHAPTQQALQKSLGQLQGTLSCHIQQLENQLVELLSMSEASFEFLDEEQRDLDFTQLVQQKLNTINQHIKALLASAKEQQQVKRGIRIALLGAVNAGKSTLFNSLFGQNRAIVTPHAGTTRDSIEAELYKNGLSWLLIDTAGLRESKDTIEQEGIKRSWQEARKADIILLVLDISVQATDELNAIYQEILDRYKEKTIVVVNKIDEKERSFALHPSLHPSIQIFFENSLRMSGGADTSYINPLKMSNTGSADSLLPTTTYAKATANMAKASNEYGHVNGKKGKIKCANFPSGSDKCIAVSAKENRGIDGLQSAIKQKIDLLFTHLHSPFLLNTRHQHLLQTLNQKLQIILDDSVEQIEFELLCQQLKELLEDFAQLTGASITQKMIDTVFSSFCVGK